MEIGTYRHGVGLPTVNDCRMRMSKVIDDVIRAVKYENSGRMTFDRFDNFDKLFTLVALTGAGDSAF